MRSIVQSIALAVVIVSSSAVLADKPAPGKSDESSKPAAQEKAPSPKCQEHGVKKSICARCNPKLEKVFKAKGDWCVEHKRPESQCVLCHPDLAKQGVK